MSYVPLLFVVAMVGATIGLGVYATAKSRSAADFFVAGRSVSVFWNASAISGEYLSAASFMGIAGLLMKNGYDALWYPACYSAGYLFLLLFIAGPLRRFGAYTIPDFAEGRFDSPLFRKVAVTFVLFIGFFYTMPQMKGAGVVLGAIMGWPYWAGIAVVGGVITFNVAFGGMKGITFVQAFQYWAKLFAISAPVFVLMSFMGGYGSNVSKAARDPTSIPPIDFAGVDVKGSDSYPANVMTFAPNGVSFVEVAGPTTVAKVTWTPPPAPGQAPTGPVVSVTRPKENYKDNEQDESSRLVLSASDRDVPVEADGGITVTPRHGQAGTAAAVARIEFGKPTSVGIQARGGAPNAPNDGRWRSPFGPMSSKYGYPLLYTYSLIIALVCGTAGLPHILVRFYTNPDGRAAKRTTLWVMVMLGVFYVFPPIWGTLGRYHLPALYANNTTDSVVIKLPMRDPIFGPILTGITSAGAFAAFMSTFSGLLVSMSGALAHDIYGRILRPRSTSTQRLVAFKVAAVLIGVVSMLLGLLVESFDIAMMVGWAFAIGAASYFPLLLLGSWWPGLTKLGAGSGMLAGGMLSLLAIVASMLLDKKILTFAVGPLGRSLMEQPAIWGVPLSIAVMVVVSRLSSHQIPADVHLKMLRLHAPEGLGLSADYIVEGPSH